MAKRSQATRADPHTPLAATGIGIGLPSSGRLRSLRANASIRMLYLGTPAANPAFGMCQIVVGWLALELADSLVDDNASAAASAQPGPKSCIERRVACAMLRPQVAIRLGRELH